MYADKIDSMKKQLMKLTEEESFRKNLMKIKLPTQITRKKKIPLKKIDKKSYEKTSEFIRKQIKGDQNKKLE